MSTTRCSYENCLQSKRTSPGLRMFSFPVQDEVRCSEWIKNSGNEELLHLTAHQLKRRFICQRHFDHRYFLSKKLASGAVPVPFETINVLKEKKINVAEEPQPSTSRGLRTPSPVGLEEEEMCYLTPSKRQRDEERRSDSDLSSSPVPVQRKKGRMQSPNLKKRLISAEKKLVRVQNQLRNKAFTAPRDLNRLSMFPRALARMQLQHKARSPWLSDEKITALSFFYKSPTAYRYLRSKNVILPSPSTIHSWHKEFVCRPGINKKLLKLVKIKAETMSPMTKECILSFDEMALKKHVAFCRSKGLVEGVEDLGEFGRKPVLAKSALVLFLRGVYSNWKLPLGFYFAATNVSGEDLKKIILKNLSVLQEMGLSPSFLVCDQSRPNQSFYNHIQVKKETPFFEHNDKKYFASFDAPHLIKSVRNNLLSGDFCNNGKIISFQDIREIYYLDKKSKTGRALIKLTDVHLNPNSFQKMKVKLAVQVMSHSVSAAIKTAAETGEMKSETAKNTAEFLDCVNDVFDALNSRSLNSKKRCNRALSDKNIQVINALKRGAKLFESLQKIGNDGKMSRPPCFDGIVLTINSILTYFEQQKKHGYEFLLTARLNQDVLENQFSIYRQRGGYARNPTVQNFQAAFKANFIFNIMKPPKTSSYEVAPSEPNLINMDELIVESSSSDDESSTSSSSTIMCVADGTLEKCAITYFAGYLSKKMDDKFSCSECHSVLSSDTPLENEADILIFYKNYNINDPVSLKKPSLLLSDVVEMCMLTFASNFEKLWSKRLFFKTMLRRIHNKLTDHKGEFLKICEEHRMFLLDLLLRTLMHKQCKDISQSQGTSHKDKISILQGK